MKVDSIENVEEPQFEINYNDFDIEENLQSTLEYPSVLERTMGMKNGMKLALVVSAMSLLFTTGCSSFHRDWRNAANTNPVGIQGQWEGTWTSDATGHTDKLRCLLTPVSEGTYEARFHAKYRKILSFGYTARFIGRQTNDVFHFSGDADLGRLAGGVYTYEGRVSPAKFFSTYNSKYDHGIFEMTRPE